MPQAHDAASSIAWQAWGRPAFAAARDEQKRVLLWLTTTWSEGCREMAARTFVDPAVMHVISAHYVAVRVDADERPDLADRYDLGGVPTTAVLESDGRLIGGGTFVPADRLDDALRRLAGRPSTETARGGDDVVAAPVAPSQTLETMIARLRDEVHGGFTTLPQFPHVAAIRVALRSGEARDHAWAARTLEAIGWMGLSDVDGGFFRYCNAADWSAPCREKLLTINAALIDLLVEAGGRGHGGHCLDRARAAIEFLETQLRRADGTWRTAASTGASRVLVDGNAVAVSALLRASAAFADQALGARAVRTLEQLLLASYRPGEGIAHCGGGVRGLLGDQIATAAACLDAWDMAGQLPHRMMAEELAHYALRTMWDDAEGGFLDRSGELADADPPGTPRVLKPFVLNCEAALVCHRLATATDDAMWAVRARDIVHVMRPFAATQGPLAAHLVLAASAISD
jgi:uncharacterized protein YyaL (SSP411 family)